ncbi:MAG: MTH1187 family thiamine-binding protein [Candidatus Thiodiazotropha endolucinida]
MSVLLEFSIFPLDKGVSVSEEVSRVIEMIDSTGIEYQLTAMGTLIETPNITQALAIVEQAAQIVHGAGCQRVYAAIKIDSRPAREHGLQGKIESIQKRLGEANLNPCVESD